MQGIAIILVICNGTFQLILFILTNEIQNILVLTFRLLFIRHYYNKHIAVSKITLNKTTKHDSISKTSKQMTSSINLAFPAKTFIITISIMHVCLTVIPYCIQMLFMDESSLS